MAISPWHLKLLLNRGGDTAQAWQISGDYVERTIAERL